MTFLEMCQHAHRLIRPGPAEPGSVPTGTTAETGILGEIVYWVRNAWLDIQAEQDRWSWMTVPASLSVTLAAGRTYPVTSFVTGGGTWATAAGSGTSADVAAERVTPFCDRYGGQFGLIYLTASGVAAQQRVHYVDIADFRGTLDIGTRASGQPRYFTVKNGNQLEFDPTPDATYTFTCDVKVTAQSLSTTSSNPLNWPVSAMGLPAHYHQWIVWRAVKMYAITRQEASALYAQAEREEKAWREKAIREFAPDIDIDAMFGNSGFTW